MPEPTTLRKVRLNKGGYEVGTGYYYGVGALVWRAELDAGGIFLSHEFRAVDRQKAKEEVRAWALREHGYRVVTFTR